MSHHVNIGQMIIKKYKPNYLIYYKNYKNYKNPLQENADSLLSFIT
jgi:hypothetical protein